jgi:TrmH family RNA methyltransferase
MIPLYKLEKLPRIQKLRKIAKILIMAEKRFLQAADKNINIFSTAEILFFTETAQLLYKDAFFSLDAKKKFKHSIAVFGSTLSDSVTAENTAQFHRALNNIKHILLAETGRDQADWDLTDRDGKLDSQKRQVFEGMQVYMEDIRSPFNVGAMFRTAESFGVEKIILSPFCADPHHRRAQRTAMGCVDIIPWERQELFYASEPADELSNNKPPANALQEVILKATSLPVFALETGGIPLAEFQFPRRGILITGSEELGVSPQALAAADASLGRMSIPCYGTKASLNVSVAFGIAIQAWAAALSKQL